MGQYIMFKLYKMLNINSVVNKSSHTKTNVISLIRREIFYKNVHSKVEKQMCCWPVLWSLKKITTNTSFLDQNMLKFARSDCCKFFKC